MWYFYSPVGTFIIAIEPSGAFGLWIDTRKLGDYNAPEEAVDAVRSQRTGYARWDDLTEIDAPKILDEWMAMPGSIV
jgi:hypothetical protein